LHWHENYAFHSRQNAETFDILHVFLSFHYSLSDLKNSPVFWPTLYAHLNVFFGYFGFLALFPAVQNLVILHLYLRDSGQGEHPQNLIFFNLFLLFLKHVQYIA